MIGNKMQAVFRSAEYFLIKSFYGTQTTKRSGVPLMNHIDEGIVIMLNRGASLDAVKAYVVHPLYQGNDEFVKRLMDVPNLPMRTVMLAMEYRRAANAYLCNHHTDNWAMLDIEHAVAPLVSDVREMLVADKLQNYKDFVQYHQGTHERSKQLTTYFENWFTLLGAGP